MCKFSFPGLTVMVEVVLVECGPFMFRNFHLLHPLPKFIFFYIYRTYFIAQLSFVSNLEYMLSAFWKYLVFPSFRRYSFCYAVVMLIPFIMLLTEEWFHRLISSAALFGPFIRQFSDYRYLSNKGSFSWAHTKLMTSHILITFAFHWIVCWLKLQS